MPRVSACIDTDDAHFITSKVYNKERKRVLNALYGPCNMCSESHAPGIQTLTNESARFK